MGKIHRIPLTVGDKAGNRATYNWNFTLDTTAPEITISNIYATFIVKPLQAIVDISPKTLNINSSGSWITGYIEVQGYSPELIDVSTVILNDTIHAEFHPTGIGDNNENGLPPKIWTSS